jgi:hypothetical protein
MTFLGCARVYRSTPVPVLKTDLISDNVQQAHVASHWVAENGFTTTGGEP